MAVKTRPHEEICDTLSWPHRASDILQSEAGTRAESEVNQMCHTAAKGKTTWVTVANVLKKCLIAKPQSD
ncbi:hypothetical protein LYNGBM3L_39880 [Moorena producens 3L]|uniref:Uncharacterized protein n=1 Tax=Moorena producens 3L TaxID=489825 RepID=F4XQ93_9CYAN|nr:hypothetical protein LYNGBM3L_39880 [Moorena producens 3L]OLT66087.1 hypothetical protein BI334_14625 [Moorena producens 3L]